MIKFEIIINMTDFLLSLFQDLTSCSLDANAMNVRGIILHKAHV